MRGHRVLLTALLVVLLSTTYTAKAQINNCTLNLPPRFVKGMRGKLTPQGNAAHMITIRQQLPSDANAIGILRSNDIFTAAGESGCDDGIYWQSIVTDKGLTGFVAESDRDEYFIEPISREIYRFGHGKAYGVSWSPDSKMLAIGSTLGIWLYTDQLKEVKLLPSYDEGVRAVAWSPDGKWIASANSDQTVQLWDVASGKSITLLRNNIRDDRADTWWDGSITWSPDSTKFASAGLDGTVRIWDVKAEKQLTVLYHDGAVYSVAWHPDGKRLASAGAHNVGQELTGVIWIWDAERGIQLKADSPKLPSSDDANLNSISFVQWVANTNTVAASTMHSETTNANSFTWNIQTNEISEIRVKREIGWSAGIRYSRDGKHLAGLVDDGGSSFVWLENANAKPLLTGIPYSVEWSNDSQYIAILDKGGEIQLTDQSLEIDPIKQTVPALFDNLDFVGFYRLDWLTVNNKNAVSVFGIDDQYQIIDVESKSIVPPTATAVTANTPTPTSPPSFPINIGGWAVASSPDEKFVVVEDGLHPSLSVYESRTQKIHLGLEHPDPRFGYSFELKVAWSPDGKYIVATDQSTDKQYYFVLWDAATGRKKLFLKVPSTDPQWHPDSTRILLSSPPTVVNLSGMVLLKLDAKTGEWMPDGERIFTSDPDKKVFRIWDGKTGQLRQTIIGTLAQLTDNKRYGAFTGDQLVIQVWDLNKEIPLITLDGLTARATILAWQPNTKRLAAASEDGAIRVWDVTTGKLVQTIGLFRQPIQSIVWKPDGTQFYTTSADGTLQLWDAR